MAQTAAFATNSFLPFLANACIEPPVSKQEALIRSLEDKGIIRWSDAWRSMRPAVFNPKDGLCIGKKDQIALLRYADVIKDNPKESYWLLDPAADKKTDDADELAFIEELMSRDDIIVDARGLFYEKEKSMIYHGDISYRRAASVFQKRMTNAIWLFFKHELDLWFIDLDPKVAQNIANDMMCGAATLHAGDKKTSALPKAPGLFQGIELFPDNSAKIREESKAFATLTDALAIWNFAIKEVDEPINYRKRATGATASSIEHTLKSYIEEVRKTTGVETMMNAYKSGVPVSDIIA